MHWELAIICKIFLVPIFKSHTWIDVNLPSGGYPIPLLSDASGSENEGDDDEDELDDIYNALVAASDEDEDDADNNGANNEGEDRSEDSWEDIDVQEENL